MAVLLCACQNAPAAQATKGLPTSKPLRQVRFETPQGLRDFRLEEARTPEAHGLGLMFRRSLPADGGMLFVFDSDMPRQFWMKNTYIPLDMIFVDGQARVVGVVASAEPQSLQQRGPNTACRYVIELAGGTAKALGIGVGTQVRLAPSTEGAL